MATRLPSARPCRIGLDGDPLSSKRMISAGAMSSSGRTPGGRFPGYLEGVNWVRTVRARIAATDPFRKDVALALAFVVAGSIETATMDAHGESRLLTGVLGVALYAPIALRRRAPDVSVVAVSAVLLLQGVIGNNFLLDASNTPFVVQ